MPKTAAAQAWLQFASECSAISEKERLASQLVETFQSIGLDYVWIAFLQDYDLPREDVRYDWLSTYPEDWRAYYEQRGCVRFDPILQGLRGDLSPFRWSELLAVKSLSTHQSGFLEMAAEAGLYNGVALPFSGSRSLQGGVVLASSCDDDTLHDLNVLWSFANLFYRRFRELSQSPAPQGRHIELTPREIAILRLSAAGHTDQRIAQNLEITKNTVNTHLKKIYRKFGAHTRVQAFAMAVRQRLIDIP